MAVAGQRARADMRLGPRPRSHPPSASQSPQNLSGFSRKPLFSCACRLSGGGRAACRAKGMAPKRAGGRTLRTGGRVVLAAHSAIPREQETDPCPPVEEGYRQQGVLETTTLDVPNIGKLQRLGGQLGLDGEPVQAV